MKRTKIIFRGVIKDVIRNGSKEDTFIIKFNRKEITLYADPFSGTTYPVEG